MATITRTIAKLLKTEFPKLVHLKPASEKELHNLAYMYFKLKGYSVNYSGGRSAPDIIITHRGKELPIEIKLAKSAREVSTGVNQLFNYMKTKREWKDGILFIWDATKAGSAVSKAEELGKQSKYSRTIYVIGIKR